MFVIIVVFNIPWYLSPNRLLIANVDWLSFSLYLKELLCYTYPKNH